MTFNQAEFDIRFEWGEQGVLQLAPISDAVISVATARGAVIIPHDAYRPTGQSPAELARSTEADLAALGFRSDIPICADMNADICAPILTGGEYVAARAEA